MSVVDLFMYVLQTYFFFPRLQAAEDDQRQHSEDMSKMEESLIMKDEIIRYNSTEIVSRKDKLIAPEKHSH